MVQSASLITTAFNLTLFPPIIVFITRSLLMTASRNLKAVLFVCAWPRTLSCLKNQWMANIRTRLSTTSSSSNYTMLSKVYHHHFNSTWIRDCHTLGMDFSRKINNYFALVLQSKQLRYSGEYVLILSLLNIHMVCCCSSRGHLHPVASTAASICRLEYDLALLWLAANKESG